MFPWVLVPTAFRVTTEAVVAVAAADGEMIVATEDVN
jgi:hypothetical protein